MKVSNLFIFLSIFLFSCETNVEEITTDESNTETPPVIIEEDIVTIVTTGGIIDSNGIVTGGTSVITTTSNDGITITEIATNTTVTGGLNNNGIITGGTIINEDSREILNTVENSNSQVSFSNDIEPLFDTFCLRCHSGGTSGSFPDLRFFDNITDNSGSIRQQVISRQMPIGATLTTEQIELVRSWIDNGTLDN